MQTIEILDIKPFMQLLFQTETLDSCAFVSAEIRTDMTYTLDGHVHHEFFTEEESEQLDIRDQLYLPWNIAKEKVFTLIKGKKTPSLLKVVLKISSEETSTLLSATGSTLHTNDIDGLFLNITFQENKLHVICGVSYRIFTMDKELEREFADFVIETFKKHNITCA